MCLLNIENLDKKIMTMHPQEKWEIPSETKRVALAIFKKGNIHLTIAQRLGQIYEDIEF